MDTYAKRKKRAIVSVLFHLFNTMKTISTVQDVKNHGFANLLLLARRVSRIICNCNCLFKCNSAILDDFILNNNVSRTFRINKTAIKSEGETGSKSDFFFFFERF